MLQWLERLPLPLVLTRTSPDQCQMWTEFVVGSRIALRVIFPGTPVLLPLQKPKFLVNNNLTRIEELHENQLKLNVIWLYQLS